MTGCDNDTLEHTLDDDQSLGVAIVVSVVIIVGIIGNSLVILAITVSRKLQTTTNMFVLNLSVADLLSCLIVMPYQVFTVLHEEENPISERLCVVLGALLYLLFAVSLLSLAFIAVYRFCLITEYRRWYISAFTRCKVYVMLASNWLGFIVFFAVCSATRIAEYGYDYRFKICSLMGYITNMVCGILLFIVEATLIVCYIMVFLRVRRHMRTTKVRLHMAPSVSIAKLSTDEARSKSDRESLNDRVVCSKSQNQRHHSVARPSRSEEAQITKNMMIVLCVFIVCTAPMSVRLLVPDFRPEWIFTYLFLAVGSSVNPIIYGLKHPRFHRTFKCLLRCRLEEIADPSPFIQRILRYRRCKTSIAM